LTQVDLELCFFSLQCFDAVGWVTGRASGLSKAERWVVSDDDLTGALHVLYLQLSPPPPSSLAPVKSRKETFWYWVTQVHLEKWPLNRRERNRFRTLLLGLLLKT